VPGRSQSAAHRATIVLKYYRINHLPATIALLGASKCEQGSRRQDWQRQWTRVRETKSSPRFLLNSVDLSGREILPTVLSVANRIAPKAVPYAERLLGDPAIAINLFEQAAASVSEAIKTKQASGSVVRDLAAYLFRTYMRLVSQTRRKEPMLQESLDVEAEDQISQRDLARAEAALLLDEIMAVCDRLTREIAFRRMEGFSWKEIGERYGLSGHAAEARFSKALDRARKRLKIQDRER